VNESISSKWKQYHRARDFERGRKKMWADGWVIAEQRTTVGKVPLDGTGNDGVLSLLFEPVLWLFNRTQPKEILHVRYEREVR
jgi:hypothetical protein